MMVKAEVGMEEEREGGRGKEETGPRTRVATAAVSGGYGDILPLSSFILFIDSVSCRLSNVDFENDNFIDV